MKLFKTIGKALLALAVVLPAATSCSENDTEGVKAHALTIHLTAGDLSADKLSDLKVIVSNNTQSDTLILGNTLTITKTYTQGSYNVFVSGKVSDEATAYVQGSAMVDLFDTKATTITLAKYNQSPLVFKTIYNTGGAKHYLLDGFVEIANNSDEVQYLDGLLLAAPLANLKAQSAWQKQYPDFYHEGGQLNGVVLAFPGSGQDYPLLPGQSVVVADQAMNHQLAYGSDESKKEEFAKTANLSAANFEKYYGNGDTDNEEVPNMVVVSMRSGSKQKAFVTGVNGRAFMLIKLPQGMTHAAFMADANNFTTMPGTTAATPYMKIPHKYVLDAVDVYASTVAVTDHYPFFQDHDDATGIQGSPSYKGKCIRRKVSRLANGRPYYQDTNNSANDFKNNQDNTPGVTPTTAD